MSTQLRNVPNCRAQNELTQTRFWGGADRMTCLQVTQVKPKSERTTSGSADFFNHLSLTRHQARRLAVELMLFAEEREVEEVEEFNADGTLIGDGEGILGDNGVMIQIRG
jgi:hypothetical protein